MMTCPIGQDLRQRALQNRHVLTFVEQGETNFAATTFMHLQIARIWDDQ
jgi:hypothetical protein